MKILVTYSSKTGNTKQVAEAVLKGLPAGTKIYPVEEAPSPDGYDLIYAGFWVDKGRPDKKASEYLRSVKNKNVMVFFTLGADPDSKHADDCESEAGACVGEGSEVRGSFRCMGKLSPCLIEMMENLPPDHPHAPDEARRKRWEKASSHPDINDLNSAALWAGETYKKANKTSKG